MKKVIVSSLFLLLTHNISLSLAQTEGFETAPFGVPMTCRIIAANKVCSTRHDPGTSAPPDKPCDAASRGRLISSVEYTTSSIRFCVTDTCTNGVRTTDRIPYTSESYRVLYYVCGDTGWNLKCTTQTDYASKCGQGAAPVSCKDCAGKSVTFTPNTLGNPTRTQSSTPELGCQEVFAKYRPQVETERRNEQLAYETVLAQSAISRTAATQSSPLARGGASCAARELTAIHPDF